MTQEERNDKVALLYLKQRKITDIEQVTARDRKVIWSILDRTNQFYCPRSRIGICIGLKHRVFVSSNLTVGTNLFINLRLQLSDQILKSESA